MNLFTDSYRDIPNMSSSYNQETQEIHKKSRLLLASGTDLASWNNLKPWFSILPDLIKVETSLKSHKREIQILLVESWTKDFQKDYSENSTILQNRLEKIDQEIEDLFGAATEEVFEDGVESEFSREFVSIIKRYGDDAMVEIARLILFDRVNAEVASEALRWLGHMNHPKTYKYRLLILEKSLYSSSVRVRDGALLGLSFLSDPSVIPSLKKAIEREKHEWLRKDMEKILAQLEKIKQCHSS